VSRRRENEILRRRVRMSPGTGPGLPRSRGHRFNIVTGRRRDRLRVLEFPVLHLLSGQKRTGPGAAREVRDEYLKERSWCVENRRKGRGVVWGRGRRKVWLQLRREGVRGGAVRTVDWSGLMGDMASPGYRARGRNPRTRCSPGRGRQAAPDLLERGLHRAVRRNRPPGSGLSPMCPAAAASCTRRSSRDCSQRIVGWQGRGPPEGRPGAGTRWRWPSLRPPRRHHGQLVTIPAGASI